MDRNTLVAFFLIALIMIFTPYYMDIVSPPQEQQPAAQQTEIDSLAVVAPSKQSVASMPQKKSDRPVSVDEKFITVENSLYQATLSSINGGSFTSFSLKNYKQKERTGLEYYFVIESKNGEQLGLVRVYDLLSDSFCWGSWLIKDGAPIYTAIESMLLIYNFGFHVLNKEMARIDVRNKNEKVLNIHKNFGAKVVEVDEIDTFFNLSKAVYLKKIDKFKKYLK